MLRFSRALQRCFCGGSDQAHKNKQLEIFAAARHFQLCCTMRQNLGAAKRMPQHGRRFGQCNPAAANAVAVRVAAVSFTPIS
ncbi:MAG: hypothetical protein AAFR09_10635, partial [Pseudomonadota bacterium]